MFYNDIRQFNTRTNHPHKYFALYINPKHVNKFIHVNLQLHGSVKGVCLSNNMLICKETHLHLKNNHNIDPKPNIDQNARLKKLNYNVYRRTQTPTTTCLSLLSPPYYFYLKIKTTTQKYSENDAAQLVDTKAC